MLGGNPDHAPVGRQLSKPVESFPADDSLLMPAAPPLRRSVTKYSSEDSPSPFGSPPLFVDAPSPVNVLMIGTGEYTTGFVNGKESDSDKGAGVVALTLMHLRLRNKTGRLALCGVNGSKFPAIRAHLHAAIASKYPSDDFSTCINELECFPRDGHTNPEAYLQALDTFSAGDAVIIFTPDDTHYPIALECIKRGMHVLITKPAVKTLSEHLHLQEEAAKRDVLCCVEVHKRWDPIYADARDRIQQMGPFSFLHSYMSQPKHQLETFKAWAGKSSDISYYLNSHHVDFHEWCLGSGARPVRVTAMASTGVATGQGLDDCEDTITLTVQWQNLTNNTNTNTNTNLGVAVYTSSWAAPRSDVHSQQRFFYMGHQGEVTVDQAHRGYSLATDQGGFRSVNPLFMKYTPTDGHFSGQGGYGYRSFEAFVDAVSELSLLKSSSSPSSTATTPTTVTTATTDNAIANATPTRNSRKFDHSLASIHTTARTTAILEAGRVSLDEGGRSVEICYNDSTSDDGDGVNDDERSWAAVAPVGLK